MPKKETAPVKCVQTARTIVTDDLKCNLSMTLLILIRACRLILSDFNSLDL